MNSINIMTSNISARHLHTHRFLFNHTETTEIYTLSLHDALPILMGLSVDPVDRHSKWSEDIKETQDRKSTRLNSSHTVISYAVFCLKKKRRLAGKSSCAARECD